VIACNTASAAGYEAAKRRFDVPVFSMIGPGIPEACRITRNRRIGLIGTKITIESGAHAAIFATVDSKVRIFGQACPLLPALIELGKLTDGETRRLIETYLRCLQEKGIDTLVLGCTHFPFVIDVIQDILGMSIRIVDPNGELVRELTEVLTDLNGLRKGVTRRQDHRFIVSRFPDTFQRVGSALLGWPIPAVEEIAVGKPVEGIEIPEKDLYNPDKVGNVDALLTQP
jgi:glutamate racemase